MRKAAACKHRAVAGFCRVLGYQASCFWVLQGPYWACKPAMQLIVVLACLVAQATGVQQPLFLNGGCFRLVQLAGVRRLDSKRQSRPVCCQGHQASAATHRGALHCHLEGRYSQEQTTCRLLHRPAAQLARLLMSAQCGPGALTHKVGTLER